MSLSPLKCIPLVLITIFFPPLGVLIIAGCSGDVLLNFVLWFLAGFPGHVHAFYVMYVYQKRKEDSASGIERKRASFIFSEKVQKGARWSTLSREKKARREEKAREVY